MSDAPFQTIADLGTVELQRKLRAFPGSTPEPGGVSRIRGVAMAWHQDGVHLDLSFHPLLHVGPKILTSLISDALVHLATPPMELHLVLALPNHVSVGMVEELMTGFDRAAKQEGVAIADVEVTASHSHLGVASTLIYDKTGYRDREDGKPHPGELLCVTGDLGAAFAGLRILLREKRVWLQHDPSGQGPFQPDLADYSEVVARQLSPVPRTDVVRAFQRMDIIPSAVWVVRNGLYNDLQLMAERFGIGAEVHASAIPIALTTRDVADELEEDVDRYALLGGEDYELLFTLDREELDRFQDEVDDVAVIGTVRPEREGVVVRTQE